LVNSRDDIKRLKDTSYEVIISVHIDDDDITTQSTLDCELRIPDTPYVKRKTFVFFQGKDHFLPVQFYRGARFGTLGYGGGRSEKKNRIRRGVNKRRLTKTADTRGMIAFLVVVSSRDGRLVREFYNESVIFALGIENIPLENRRSSCWRLRGRRNVGVDNALYAGPDLAQVPP